MTNVNLTAARLLPQAGAGNQGYKIGYIKSGAKAAQNDTWTVTNAQQVYFVVAEVDASGVAEAVTIGTGASANVITLTSATATACSAFVIYR